MAQPAGIARNVVDENNWTPVARKALAGMKMNKRPQATYLLGAVIVWAGLIAAMAVILGGTPHFGEIVPILFLVFLLFGLSAFAPRRSADTHPRPR